MSSKIMSTNEGSSPRMRGAPPPKYGQIPGCRIIPADAGSTQYPTARFQGRKDHPRGCGEHSFRTFQETN